MVKARVEERGDLLLIITEYNQYAIVPRDKICELIVRFNIEITNRKFECEVSRVGEE